MSIRAPLQPACVGTRGATFIYACNDGACVHAAGQGRCPLVLFSAGFLLHSSLYRSYAADLASHGFVVARYDLPEVVDDLVMVDTMG